MKEATSALAIGYYDYIIIGGGTSGCPLAATLSQGARVLVLKRRGSPYDNKNITNMENFPKTLSDTSSTSLAQQFVSQEGVFNVRARVLGGGSALNAGFYMHASTHYVKETGWDETLVNQSYEWVEKLVAFRPPTLEWQSTVRDGLLEVGVLPYNGFTYDHLYETKVGGTIFDREGHRHTATDLLEYADPTRITVYLHATVYNILFRHNIGKARARAHGVVFKDAFGVMHKAYLIKNSMSEIILSAGAIGSPQLLMLSGIGPRDQLQAHGIEVVLDQPLVGQGMADNPMNMLFVPSPQPVEVSLIQAVGITRLTSPSQCPSEAMAEAVEIINAIANGTIKGGVILEKVIAPNYSFLLKATSALANANYDYIIIGGGTASCALATTLSQGANVLVLERGGSPYDNPKVTDVVNESYQWVEKLVAFKPPMLQWKSAVRDGLLEAGVSPNNGFTYDHLYGTKAGGIIFDKDGHRHGAADLLEYVDPTKIKVYLHATVYNILFRNNNAGAIGSPQLLMLSGIGPADELARRRASSPGCHNVEVFLSPGQFRFMIFCDIFLRTMRDNRCLPMVGQDMADNPMNFVFVPSPNPVEVSLIQVVGITKSDSYIEAASGLSICSSWAQKISGSILKFLLKLKLKFIRLGHFTLNLKTGLASEVLLEMALAAGNVNETIRGGVILQKTNGPISKGNLKLLSTNPLNPSVTFNYYKEPEDLKKCVDGMKNIMSVIDSKAFSKFRYGQIPVQALMEMMLYLPVNTRKKHLSASISFEKFCIDTVTTIWHYHGGCQVGKVVDTNYRVLGVDALRVIDGSTFNSSPWDESSSYCNDAWKVHGTKDSARKIIH
uniref:Glucose-methanol-choline oxidoreductase N-terminal domain-containing protein n=1 Tax=Fagus sylvatica TaxID=28930 RepID=A0A2N9FUN6_FAGSY